MRKRPQGAISSLHLMFWQIIKTRRFAPRGDEAVASLTCFWYESNISFNLSKIGTNHPTKGRVHARPFPFLIQYAVGRTITPHKL